MAEEALPQRKTRWEFHCPPPWVPESATFFITVNCARRELNQLARMPVTTGLAGAADFYQRQGQWSVELLMVMPDHIHLLAAFKWDEGNGMGSMIRNWKRFTANQLGIEWQRDYFDHRIRSEADHQSTWYYMRENPVRAGLVKKFEEWPYVWRPEHGLGW